MDERTAMPPDRRSTHEQAGQSDPATEQQYQSEEGAKETGAPEDGSEAPDHPRQGERRDAAGEGTHDPDDPGYTGWDHR